MKKTFMTVMIIIGGFAIFIWVIFVKPTLVEESNFLKLCINYDEKLIKIELMESVKYISKYSTRVEDNILYIDVYATTILNPFAKKTNVVQFSILDNIKIVVLANKKSSVNLIPHCKTLQIENTIIQKN